MTNCWLYFKRTCSLGSVCQSKVGCWYVPVTKKCVSEVVHLGINISSRYILRADQVGGRRGIVLADHDPCISKEMKASRIDAYVVVTNSQKWGQLCWRWLNCQYAEP